MGVAIPQIISEDKASGALVVDGSLKFNSSKSHYLTRTPSSAGNRRTFTISMWVKKCGSGRQAIFGAGTTNLSGQPGGSIYFDSSTGTLRVVNGGGTTNNYVTDSNLRDSSGWYHCVVAIDTTQSTSTNRIKLYINGNLQSSSGTISSQNFELDYNNTIIHAIGSRTDDGGLPASVFDGLMSQVYFIDGQQLDASYFGYTDPLTNTWRPKKINLSNITTGKVYIDNTYTGGSVGSGVYNASLTGNITAGSYSGDTFTASNAAWVITFDLRNYDSFTLSSWSVGAQSNQTWYYSNDSSFASGVTGPNSGTIASGTWSTTISGTKYRYLRFQNVPSATFSVVGNITNSQNAWGINGFYLPFDGNSPIGQDQSGRGNNWTPVNFGGSNTLEKATGALPILNTDGGGKVARVGVRTDSNASSLVLALPLVGNANDISATIKGSGSNKTITVNGNAAASSAQSNFYGGSFYFDGSGDYLSLTTTSDFAFGTGDFTIEFWAYVPTAEASNLLPVFDNDYNSTGGVAVAIRQSDNFFSIGPTAGGAGLSYCRFNSTPWALNTWNHFAMTSNGGIYRAFINGNEVTTSDTTTAVNISRSSGTTEIGRLVGQTSFDFGGYLQDLRIYKGLAKYTQNFIPASTDPDILPDTPSGVAYSSNVTSITDGAVAFQGTSGPAAATNYLNAGTSSDFTIGTNDNFTFEAFINPTSVSDTSVFGIGSSTTFAYRIISGSPYLYIQTTGGILNTGTIAANKWTHIAVTRNGGTLYSFIDGVLVGSVANTGSFDASTGTGAGTFIGAANLTQVSPPNYSFTGQISNLHWVKGTALYTSNFTPPSAPITSVANTKLLCCKSNSSATAFDVSPGSITANGNAAATNFNPFTVNINTQRGQESGYATWNPLAGDNAASPTPATFTNGNLTVSYDRQSSGAPWCPGTIAIPSSGKWYWECVPTASSPTPPATLYGISNITDSKKSVSSVINRSIYLYDGQKVSNTTYSSYASAFSIGDTIGIAVNMDSGIIGFYKNGIYLGNAFTDLISSGYTWVPFLGMGGQNSGTTDANFGQKPFKFPPPAGFQPLALANTPRPTIVRPDQYVGIVTWTGSVATASATPGVNEPPVRTGWNFKPDFLWIKDRNQAWSIGHRLYDSVRGLGVNKHLNTEETSAEGSGNDETYGYVTGFVNGGFTSANGTSGNDYVNSSVTNYVGWAWKAGGSGGGLSFWKDDVGYSTASAAGLTAGTITPTGASVNTKSGFSIITYTGTNANATISHGLGNVPAFIIAKSRDTSSWNWIVYHKDIGVSDYLALESTQGSDTRFANIWGTGHTTSVFGVRTGYSNNPNGEQMVAYCWAEISGFSKFGSYTGNGSTDGPVVITGFRPRWLLVKKLSATGNVRGWVIVDSERSKYNVSNLTLFPHAAATEDAGTYIAVDFLSNGFKLRSTEEAANQSYTYIYAAFAETPSFNLYGGQANAR